MIALFRRIRQALSSPPPRAAIDRLAARFEKLARRDDKRQERLRRQIRSLEDRQSEQFRELQARIRSLDRSLRSAVRGQKDAAKLLASVREQTIATRAQTRALLRARYLAEDAADPAALALQKRFPYSSQHEEDGIVYSLLRTIGMPTRRLVDIGCGDFGGNSAWLLLECGFQGLLVDASPIAVRLSRRMFADRRVEVRQAMVSSANVEQLLADAGIPREFDVLSIDVDGVDYWIWATMTWQPRLVVIEYNSAFGPDAAVTIPDVENFTRRAGSDERLYFGASLTALAALGRRKGYRLILTEPSGTNAFFVREDLAGPFPTATPGDHYRMYFSHRRELEKLGTADLTAYFRDRGLPLVQVA